MTEVGGIAFKGFIVTYRQRNKKVFTVFIPLHSRLHAKACVCQFLSILSVDHLS